MITVGIINKKDFIFQSDKSKVPVYMVYMYQVFFFYFEQIDKILQNTKETLHLTLERGASPSVSRRPTESQEDSFYLSPDDSPVSNDESLSTERIVNGVSVKIRAKRDQMK